MKHGFTKILLWKILYFQIPKRKKQHSVKYASTKNSAINKQSLYPNQQLSLVKNAIIFTLYNMYVKYPTTTITPNRAMYSPTDCTSPIVSRSSRCGTPAGKGYLIRLFPNCQTWKYVFQRINWAKLDISPGQLRVIAASSQGESFRIHVGHPNLSS